MAIIECLSCGQTRPEPRPSAHRVVTGGGCSRCGYVGWARSEELTEPARRLLRERPVPRRRLLIVA